MTEARVQQIYDQLKQMAVAFRLRPGDRLNEGALARELGVSRTPLREALNRLVAEDLVTFQPGNGFFCREIDVQTVFDLFELRQILEEQAVRLACLRADDADLQALAQDLATRGMDVRGLTVAEACQRDEAFHIAIARMSGNAVLAQQLQRINERLRYIRWVSITLELAQKSKTEHHAIMQALLHRDADAAAIAMSHHITRRREQVHQVVRNGVASIYMDTQNTLSETVLEESAP